MGTIINILILVVNFGCVAADRCYTRYSWGSYYSYYCSGYCVGSYGYEYCSYDTNIAVGAIAGIVIGSLIFLGVVIAIIVAICCSCLKTSGSRGRVVHPVSNTAGVAVVHTHGAYYSAQPTAPPYGYTQPAYGPTFQQNPQVVPPPAPTYSAYPPQPPPYPPTANTQEKQPDDEHVPHPPLSTSSENPLSRFSGPNSNLQRNN